MSGLKRLFCEHPESVNETYFQHLMFAIGFGLRMVWAGLACIIHGIFPFLCVRTGSDCIRELHTHLAATGRPHNDVDVKGKQVAQG